MNYSKMTQAELEAAYARSGERLQWRRDRGIFSLLVLLLVFLALATTVPAGIALLPLAPPFLFYVCQVFSYRKEDHQYLCLSLVVHIRAYVKAVKVKQAENG
jgi:hypothetical protein